MKYIITAHTDIGIKKKTNQDSAAVYKALFKGNECVFAVLCDGMGGLAKGEVASASVIEAYTRWFKDEFPSIAENGFKKEDIFKTWENIALQMNSKIAAYGSERSISLGTTLTAILLFDKQYYIINIGDSRIYKFDNKVSVLTKDHTFVQRELDMGRMTLEEAKVHPKRNVLLQCIGASAVIEPDFFSGVVADNEVYMLCSDGFRHIITEDELFEQFSPSRRQTSEMLNKSAVYLTDLNKYRRETDNISVILIRSE